MGSGASLSESGEVAYPKRHASPKKKQSKNPKSVHQSASLMMSDSTENFLTKRLQKAKQLVKEW
jgi:hypothetical protein